MEPKDTIIKLDNLCRDYVMGDSIVRAVCDVDLTIRKVYKVI